MKKRFYFLLGILFIILLSGSGSWGLTESSEARYAEVAREMFLSRDYLHPSLLGIYHYHKPPITYQLTALGYQIFGINEFGARFFLSVAVLMQLFFIYRIGLLLFSSEKKAIGSALIYFSFPLVLISARNLTTDAFLTTFILWALYFWLLRKNGRPLRYLYGFYLLLSLAVLTKGPVTLLPPLFFILIWKIIKKEEIKFGAHTIVGSILFFFLASSWFTAIFIDRPELFNHFIQDEIIHRSMGAENLHRDEPFWYYLLYAPLLGLPWFIFVGIELIRSGRVKKINHIEIILLWTILLLLLVFSLFSSKLILYLLPVYPFISLLGGSLITRTSGRRLEIYSWVYAALFLMAFAGIIYLYNLEQFKFDLLYTLFLLFLLSCLLFYFLRFKENKIFSPVTMGVGLSIVLLFTFTWFATQNDEEINSIKNLSSFLKQETQGKIENVIIYDYLLPSAAFYFNDRVISVADSYYNSQRETEFENDSLYKTNYIDLRQKGELNRFKTLLKKKNNVLIFRKKREFPDSLQYLLKIFPNTIEKGRWRVYY